MSKIPGAISRLSLNAATFHNCVFEASYLNFFFGRNGVGKSTIAGVLTATDGLTWQNVNGRNAHTILVYGRQFVEDNFANYDSLGGVFTLGKHSIEAQQQLKELQEALAEQQAISQTSATDSQAKKDEREQLLTDFQEACWEESKDIRAWFPATQEGRKHKRTFAEAILAAKTTQPHDLDEVARLYAIAFDKSATTFEPMQSLLLDLPDDHVMGTSIVSSAQTDFAKFVEIINAADWVRHGQESFQTHEGEPCPFCQRALPAGFDERLAECFDDAYEESVRQLQTFAENYKETARLVWAIPASNSITNRFPEMDVKTYDDAIELLKSKLQSNVELINKKLANPSVQLKLEDVSVLVESFNKLVTDTNQAISDHNDVVANQKQQQRACIQQVWEHLANLLHKTTSTFREADKQLEEEIATANQAVITANTAASEISQQIKALRGSVVDTGAVMEQINTVLKESGFQGFHLAGEPGVQNTYRVVRPDGSTAENLSEGERNFIAFLYFYFLVHGSLDESGDPRGKIVVIDDPVSSMDSSALFIVAAHVRELVSICENNVEYRHDTGRGNFIKQIFILTHNAYFFREVSYNHLSNYGYASYFLINKNDNRSSVTPCVRRRGDAPALEENYSPVINSYAALWAEYKEVNSAITLLNVARRILEHYFLQLCGYDGSDLATRLLKDNRHHFVATDQEGNEDLSNYHLVSSMLAYINHHMSGIGDDTYFVAEAHDPGQLRHVFELIFTLTNQEQHYRMMTGGHQNGNSTVHVGGASRD